MSRERDRLLREFEELRWPKGASSPYFKGGNCKKKGNHRFHCYKTNRVFSVLTKTHLSALMRSLENFDRFLDILLADGEDAEIREKLSICHITLRNYYLVIFNTYKMQMCYFPQFNKKARNRIKGKSKEAIYKKLLCVQ